jgi:hypothetical protein
MRFVFVIFLNKELDDPLEVMSVICIVPYGNIDYNLNMSLFSKRLQSSEELQGGSSRISRTFRNASKRR